MLAILYLVAVIYLGDRISGSFYRFRSIQHRLATAFLIGLLMSTIITYLGALAFARLSQPLIAGNLVFLVAFAVLAYKLPRSPEPVTYLQSSSTVWDWVFLLIFFLFSCWLISTTLGFKDGSFQIPFKAWSDYGANLSLTQSFALGHNFPTDHPFFPGEPIRYHFLFWFQAANFEFLGLSLVHSVNLLSLLSLISLLILIMSFAENLFDSKVTGRIAAFFFFFSTSLSYIPFLRSQPSLREAITAIVTRTQFIASGYQFRGEDWGVLTVDVFANQRHLISGLGLLFVVLTFLAERYKSSGAHLVDSSEWGGPAPFSLLNSGHKLQPPTEKTDSLECDGPASLSPSARTRDESGSGAVEVEPVPTRSDKFQGGPKRRLAAALHRVGPLQPFVFSGIVIGCLPYWNSAIFVTAMIVLAAFLVLLPSRLQLATLFTTAFIVGLPQVLLLRLGTYTPPDYSIFHWGYTLQNPTLMLLFKYLFWTFGFKWLLILVALILLPGFHRRMFLALSGLLVAVFLFRLSTDIFNNHKLLNSWSVFAGVYAAYGLWRIGKMRLGKLEFAGPALAVLLTLFTIAEGLFNLFPVRNDSILVVPNKNDQLTDWVLNNTRPTDVFLTQTVLTHPILFAGRRIYLGYTLFAWTAGYHVAPREYQYRRMFEERDPDELQRLLRENGIVYVGIDDGVRSNQLIRGLNESVYQQHFQKVFEDPGHHYDNIAIYKVPQ